MTLLAALPAPVKVQQFPVAVSNASPSKELVSLAKEAPPYLRRKGFVPRRQEDFFDGGAFPEIPVAQYPLDMGRGDSLKGVKTLAVTINSDGQLNYDAIVKQGENKGRIIYSDHKALVPKVDLLEKNLTKPDEDEIQKTAKETMAALQLSVDKKLAVTNPSTLPKQPGEAQTIKYTPSQKGSQYNSGAAHRTVKMFEMPVDPLEPPKFRHVKVPRGTGSPPVPVMHSPPRPLSVKDMQDWKIPPCISNWKNPKGYTIPLDKRLAADGRGLQESTINDKFAHLSEALYIAEQKAREAIEMRAKIQKELLTKEREKKEQELRQLALKARMERVGGIAGRAEGASAAAGGGGMMDDDDDLPPPPPPPHYKETAEERAERIQREELREERRRERERERRLEAKDAHGSKKSKLTRDRERDVSEKVALGMAHVQTGGEVTYDQRLFNQDAGFSSNFGAEDSYNLYDKPLFNDRSGIYRTGKMAMEEDDAGPAEAGPRTDRFKPDKGFQGGDTGAGPRSRPVEFERNAVEADPFGLDQFLTEVKGKKKGGTLDGIGTGGGMRAAAGGGMVDEYGAGSSRRMHFTSGQL